MADDNTNLSATPFARATPVAKKRTLTLKPVPIVIGLVFIGLALAALFMFSARAIRITTSPPADTITITAGLPSYQLGERYLMLPGDYEVRAQLEGYFTRDTPFIVGSEPDQDFQFDLVKLPGQLNITTTNGEAAEVYIDNQAAGTTPLQLSEISPGLREVSLITDRYLPFQTDIDIKGKRIEQFLVAELEPAWADVTMASSPAGATVRVDEKIVGVTPLTLELLQGKQPVSVKLKGYKVWQSELEITAGEDQVLNNVVLIKSDGKVSIKTTPPGANITINKRYQGQSPLAATLRPGERYEVLLSKAGFKPASRTINITPDEDIALNVKLDPIVGIIRLRVTPADSELYVDGKLLGRPVDQLTLTASRHTIEVSKPGYASYQAEVTPQPGLSQQLLISLQTIEEAKIASIPQQITTGAGQQLNLILPGAFEMGAGRRERGRRSNEISKQVELTRSYYLGVHEVTNKAFAQFEPGHDPGFFGRAVLNEEDRPVVNISWDQAVRYSNYLSKLDNLPPAYEQVKGKWQLIQPATIGYRLPTEAEWAWAARYDNGQASRFPWGAIMPPPEGHGNYADESALNMVPYHIAGYNDSYRGPAPVGTFSANSYGLYDLSGNVSEWTGDYYSVELARDLLVDPTGPSTGDYHVIRGSNYTHGRFSELRWTYRDYGADPRRDVGFRLARYVE